MAIDQHRHTQLYDSAADWASINPTLEAGTLGIESDTRKIKIGDGITQWTGLPYAVDLGGYATETYVDDEIAALSGTYLTQTLGLARAAVQGATVAATETTVSASYVDLTTPGPAATVTIGSSGRALVIMSAAIQNSGAAGSFMSFAVSGASTRAAANDDAAYVIGTNGVTAALVRLITGLTAGSNTFTAKYLSSGGTATFGRRGMVVIPL
jgi:hypothetical protein